jgi:hypothetical protein
VKWIRHAIERPGYLPSFVPIIGSLEYISSELANEPMQDVGSVKIGIITYSHLK